MENKDPQGMLLPEESGGVKPPPENTLHTPPMESSALSFEPTDSQMLISQEQPESKVHRFLRFARRIDVILVILLLLAGIAVLFSVLNNRIRQRESQQPSVASGFNTVKIPLEELVGGKDLSLSGAANVTINGMMQLNNSLLVSPSVQPTGAKPGQLYYDQATNQLAYFNGQVFVFLTAPTPATGGVQSLGGATGQLTLGSGLTLVNGQLNNNGVLSIQGQNGNVAFTAGPGLVINGTTFSNSGILSVASGTPNVSIANDGNGGVTISVASGAGTVTSSGGTVGRIPVFTASQNLEDSIISQSGLTVTITGDLSVITGGLSLSNALTVSNGGTGATSFSNNGVLVGQGTGPITAVTAGGPGLCLMSTGGLPVWGACPGGTGVTSLNGLSGALNIANASAAGSTITIDDASTTAKGIASFNATNFNVASGAVNTIQNINTGATPTFAGVNTNNITPSAALTVGSASQALTLQGNATTTLTATNGANTTALSFVAPTANVTYRLQTASAGTYDICTTAGNCATGGVTSPGGTTNRLAKFTGAQVIGDSIIVDNGSNVDVGGTLSVQGAATFVGDIAVNGGDITSSGALNITPAGTLTVGVSGQQLTLQGNASTSLTATSGANTTSLTFQAPTANVTYRLPTASAGTYDICTTAGNCVGTGGGVTTSGGTVNRLAKFSGAQTINDSTITDDGTNVTTSVDLIIQGGDVTVGVANSQTGSIKLAHSGSAFVGTFLQGALTADRTYTLPDADGTICLSSGNCSGAGSPNTLQAAYDAGNTITTVSARDIAITLADSASDSNFTVTTSTGATGYVGIVRADGAGTADPAQLLLLDNLDADRVQPTGLRIQAAGGGITTAIDVSDAEITTAINIGANDILGTTGNIDLSNFDVVGATGNVTTSGTINGQTISNAASFTGTVAIAGNATLASDLAVNGGDITSSGALNITPGGTLTVGAVGQQLILQGNASTQLTATGGGFTTTVGFTGTPTGAVNYNFDRAAAAGTYTICTTIGNCAGTGGGVTTPGGTTGTLAKFTGPQTLGDSLLAESGSTVTVNGNLNLTSGNQFQVNGTQISSANLSNDANLAKLNASQTFTGNMIAFQNGADSTNAFNVQNAAGHRIVTVDSSNAQLVLGTANTLDGKLVFSNVSNANTVTILPGTPTANRTLTLPDTSGVICTDSGNCAGAGATLQTAYNFSVGGTTPKIKVNSSLGGVDIQDADTPIGANLLNIRASNGAGLGSVIFGVGNTGEVTLQNSANSTAAFRLLTAGGTSVLTGDTTNGQILLGQSSTLSGSIVFRNATNSNTITLVSGVATTGRTITLPDADGTICLTSGNCSGAGSPNTLQAAYDAGNTITTISARDLQFSMADSATDSNFLVDLQCDTSCGANGRFAIQDDGTDVFTVLPAGGAALFRNSVNSITAFRVQNASGAVSVFTLDTTNILTRISGAGTDASLVSGTGALQIGNDNADNLAIDDNEIIARNNGGTSTLFLQGGGGGLNVGANLVTFQNAANGNNAFNVNNASGVAVVAIDTIDGELELGSSSALTGTLLFRNSTNSFTTSLSPTAATANRVITLPDASGTVCLQSSSACGFVTGSAADYIQNQNSASQTANWRITGTGRADTALQAPLLDTTSAGALAIGTTNATAINLQQDTTIASGKTLTIQGSTLVQPASDGTSVFNVRTSAGNNIFTIDTANTRIGIGLGGSVVPTLANAGVEIRGALRLSGGNGTYADTYVTPNGGTVNSLINIANYDPGASAQIIAFGLPSGANTNSRALSLFDARASAHQPTLAVLSPDQNQIAGFSWDGSNSLFLTKTSSNNMALQANGLNILTLQNVSSAARLGIGNGTPGYALDVTGDANISVGSAYKIGGVDICTGSGCVPVTTCNVSGNYICNGGNTPVSSVAIGTTNAQPLNFMTNGTTRAFITETGVFTVQGNGTGTARIAGDCGSNYTAVNLSGTAFDCTNYNLLSSPTDTSLYINRPSGSSIFVREGNSSTNQMSISGGGAFTAQNSTDTTAGFRVLNAGSVPQLQIDTSNSRVYIGNPAADTTGALLVLDTKTDAADPTGVEGGMYYSSFYKRLRCYYDGQWRFCNDPAGMTWGYNIQEEFLGVSGTDRGETGWIDNPAGNGCGAGGSTASVVPDLANRPGQIEMITGTSATGCSSLYMGYLGAANVEGITILGGEEIEFALKIPTVADATNDYRLRMGLCDTDAGTDNCRDGLWFALDRTISTTNWVYASANASTRTQTASSTAITSGWHRFKIAVSPNCAVSCTVSYYVDGTLIGTINNTNIPKTNGTQPMFAIGKKAGTSSRTLTVDYFQYRNTLTSPR